MNQVWRIDLLEDGEPGVPLPLLGELGRLLLVGSLVAGAALFRTAAHGRG